MDIFWPDEPLERARTCLRSALSSLRRQLDDTDLFLEAPRDMVKLRPDAITTDVADFEEAARSGDPGATGLYNGPLLPGCYYDWAFDERHRLEAIYEGLPTRTTWQATDQGPMDRDYFLPAPVSAFYGREAELVELRSIVDSGARLVTLVGLGGIGKTRLAIEFARTAPGRIAFVELADVHAPEQIPIVVLEALRRSRETIDVAQAMLEGELDKEPCLLILDNFEQLVETGGPEWVAKTLEAVPGLRLVVTSRISLGLTGEHTYLVPPLSEDASVGLFLDRARAALPGFANSEVLPILCDRLDRMPLAIELCASWANVLSCTRMLEALSDRFELIRTRKRNVPERQKSLIAVLEWTCPEDRDLRESFAKLSVMRGTWTLEAAEAVVGDDASEVLDRLMERALVQRLSVGEAPRFSMLEAVREFAAKLLEDGEAETARLRHNRYFCRLAIALGNEHTRNSRRGFELLEREHANILAAFQYGVTASGEVLEATISAMDFLRWIWWVRGYEPQFHALVALLATHDHEPLSGNLRAQILRSKARQAAREGRYSDAVRCLSDAREIWIGIGESGLASEAITVLADYKIAMGNVEDAIADLRAGLALLEEGTEGHCIMMAELAGALIRVPEGLEESERLCRHLLGHWSTQPERTGHQAVLSAALAECMLKRGDPAPAEPLLRNAIAWLDDRGELVRAVSAVERLAECLSALGRGDEADVVRMEAAKRRAILQSQR